MVVDATVSAKTIIKIIHKSKINKIPQMIYLKNIFLGLGLVFKSETCETLCLRLKDKARATHSLRHEYKMKIPSSQFLIFALITLCLLINTIEAKKKKGKSLFPKKHKHKSKKKAAAPPPPPQDPIPHGIYRQTGKCFCPIGSTSNGSDKDE